MPRSLKTKYPTALTKVLNGSIKIISKSTTNIVLTTKMLILSIATKTENPKAIPIIQNAKP